jgi:hypothetical protein
VLFAAQNSWSISTGRAVEPILRGRRCLPHGVSRGGRRWGWARNLATYTEWVEFPCVALNAANVPKAHFPRKERHFARSNKDYAGYYFCTTECVVFWCINAPFYSLLSGYIKHDLNKYSCFEKLVWG